MTKRRTELDELIRKEDEAQERKERELIRKSSRELSPYQRIMRAVKKRRGVRLSYEECRGMSMDEAIRQLAQKDDEDDELSATEEPAPGERSAK